jgi:hypothetical protein
VTGDLTAVDVQDLAGDEGRRLEEQDAVHDVADLADPSQRVQPGERVVAFRRVRRRRDDARWVSQKNPVRLTPTTSA